jgi:hypothetical protein
MDLASNLGGKIQKAEVLSAVDTSVSLSFFIFFSILFFNYRRIMILDFDSEAHVMLIEKRFMFLVT